MKKKGLTLHYGTAIGQGYTDIIEDIISVHIEVDVVTVIGHVRGVNSYLKKGYK